MRVGSWDRGIGYSACLASYRSGRECGCMQSCPRERPPELRQSHDSHPSQAIRIKMCSGASQIGGVPTCHGGGSRFFIPYVYISQRLYSSSRIEWPERPPFAPHEFPLAMGVASSRLCRRRWDRSRGKTEPRMNTYERDFFDKIELRQLSRCFSAGFCEDFQSSVLVAPLSNIFEI